ncbi:hypothetical protein [Devosia sp. Leaf64]|uniref:hypothetical protein n=1 Tax=Devosia sp. Leaf64 TaxID=1736229 RepID=UPI000713FD1D|nr:hypothetical protein [Devosia sp. Leaf64]KQN74798.1 hypothetical protein ASE94_00180 [Devosia sp. Leaf64]
MTLRSILATVAIALLASAAAAQDIVPEVLLQPAQSSVPGRTIDIRGLVTGMSVEEARSAFADLGGDAPNENTSSFVLSGKGQTVQSAPYTSVLYQGDETDQLSAKFSALSSGNQITLVAREADYRRAPEAAPLFDDFVSALVAKYGEPSFRKDGREVTYLRWTYKDGLPVPCYPEGTPQCLEPQSAMMMLPQQAEAFDVIVSAMVGRKRGEDSLIAFKLALTSLELKLAADMADEAGMRPALEQAIAAAAANAPKPKL